MPQEEWEDASPLLQLVATSENSTDGPPSLRKLRPADADDDDWLPGNTATLSPPLFADETLAVDTAGPSEHQKFPWETNTRYVIGSGELGMLSELQMPRRGSAVSLPPEFLRLPIPTGYAPDGEGNSPPTAAPTSQLIYLDDDVDDDYWREPSVEVRADLAVNTTATTSSGGGAGSANRAQQTQQPALKDVTGGDSRTTALFEPRYLSGSIASADARPHASGSNGRGGVTGGTAAASTGTFLGAPITPVRDVETASAADRIAAFRPGTRFRVAVDKGSTGLGITVKDIRGRFFVYRLQALPDGSPGAAEVRGLRIVALTVWIGSGCFSGVMWFRGTVLFCSCCTVLVQQ